jgi:hypothetical protein
MSASQGLLSKLTRGTKAEKAAALALYHQRLAEERKAK